MTGNDDDAVFCSRIFRDDVVNRKLALGRIGGKDVVLDLIAFQMRGNVLFDFLVTGTAQRSRTELHNLFHILHGTIAIRGRQRTIIRGKIQGLDRGRACRDGCILGRGVLIAIAGDHCQPARQQDPRKPLHSAHHAFFSRLAARCLGCTSHATPMLTP